VKPARMWFALLALFALLVFTGTVSAQPPGGGRGGPPPGGGGRPSFDKLLDAFDANDDGKLDKSEVPPPVWRRLSQADANGDGVVTKAEFDAR